MIIVGIDPGASGALCVLFTDTMLTVDFKSKGLKGYIDVLKTIDYPIDMVVIEKVHSMPGQGVKSMFSFGQRLGELEGMLMTLQLPYEKIPPREWQKACKIKPKSGKQGAYDVISNLYPYAQLVGPKGGIKDGRCDAIGLAHYARLKYVKEQP